jgi:hypothetical protein
MLKVIIAALSAGLAGASGGIIKLYGEVQVLKADTQLGRRVETIEILLKDVTSDRDKRTIVIQQFRDTNLEVKAAIVDLQHRLDVLERRR